MLNFKIVIYEEGKSLLLSNDIIYTLMTLIIHNIFFKGKIAQ